MKISFETRYEIWPAKERTKFIDLLYEPYKVRGNRKEIFAKSGRFNSRTVRHGNIINWGEDKKGFYAIFQPKSQEYEKIKVFAEIEQKSKITSEIYSLQIELRKPGKSIDDLKNIEQTIDNLYYELFPKTREILPNDNPFMNVDDFEIFKDYITKYIIEPYIDYSYLFQRLLRDGKIKRTKHLEFADWLKQNSYVKDRLYDDILRNRGFRTLSKSYSIQRENNYNVLFGI